MAPRPLPDSPPRGPTPGSIEDYESRRCAVCGVKYPCFGFGPPLTKPGLTLWACRDHREELDQRLRPEATEPLGPSQTTLF
jgi:hypothetical protein